MFPKSQFKFLMLPPKGRRGKREEGNCFATTILAIFSLSL
jgi:hypothetical protein